MERPRRGCVNLPYLAGTKKRPVKKRPYKLISSSKYKLSWILREVGMKKKFQECMTNGKTSTISLVELSSKAASLKTKLIFNSPFHKLPSQMACFLIGTISILF